MDRIGFVVISFILFITGCTAVGTTYQPENLKLIKLFSNKASQKLNFDARILVSPLLDISQQKPRIIVPYENGVVAFQDLETGEVTGTVVLPGKEGKRIQISATPLIFDSYLVIVYQYVQEGRRVSYHAAVVNLETNEIDENFPVLDLNAKKTTVDHLKTVSFNPVNAYPHSALKYAPQKNSPLGLIYVSFGNAGDLQPYHGWVFEIDMQAWLRKGAAKAISSVLVVTPESECPVEFKSGNREMICGGGVWTPAGPQVNLKKEGFELLVPTGNGQLDLKRKDYANTLMRLKQGLQFDPECDEQLCANFDPVNPELACIESCKNLFIPRLAAENKPIRPASGDCDDKSFWECLAWMDYDLGASAPVKVNLKDGPEVWVQPGKEGGVYLIDAEHLGTQYDRMQIIEICGTKADPCKLSWRGTIVTHPVVDYSEQDPIVIIPTFISDSTNPAGLIALKIVMENKIPKFKKHWQFTGSSKKPITKSFRGHPTLPVIANLGKHAEAYVWVVDISKSGTLYGVRVKDGSLAAQIALDGTGYPLSKPIIYNNKIYVVSNEPGIKKAWLEGYRIEIEN